MAYTHIYQDTYSVKGQLSTVGFVESLKHQAKDSNAALTQLLLDAGAVLYCKTNVPQTMMVRYYPAKRA